MDGDVTPLGLAASLTLVGMALILSWRRGLRLERDLAVAADGAVWAVTDEADGKLVRLAAVN